MVLNHVAVYCSSEERSDLFYSNLLGLKKANTRVLPGALMEQIFGLDRELRMINYANDDIRFEVFIGDMKDLEVHKIGHVCVEVDDRDAFMQACEVMGLKMNRVPRDDSFLLFISDYDGNLFEIKEKQKG